MSKLNLKNKLLIIMTIALIIFSISSNVFALSSSECGEFSETVLNYVKALPEFSNYDYYIVEANCSFSQQNPYVHVFLFNDSTVKFYNGTANGWASIDSNKSFEFYHYVLVYDGYSGNISSIYYEGLENKQINNVCSGMLNHTGYPIYANVDIYTDSSCTDFFFQRAVVLLRPMKIQEIPKIVREIAIILVPVGLIIFGSLCLLYLLSSKKWLRL